MRMNTNDAQRLKIRRRGRPAQTPTTALARHINTYLDAAGCTYTSLAHRLHVSRHTLARWLTGATLTTNHISLERVADALELGGAQRHQFIQTAQSCLARYPSPSSGSDAQATTPGRKSRSAHRTSTSMPDTGAPTHRAPQALTGTGAYLKTAMQRIGINQRELARRLGVSRATITNLLHGYQKRSRKVTMMNLCAALELTGMKRREFLLGMAQAGAAGMLAVAGAAEAPRLFQLHHMRLDLDAIDHRLDELTQLHHLGQLQLAQDGLREIHKTLAHARLKERDTHAAQVKIHYASLQATVYESILPWFSRAHQVIAAYNRLEDQVLYRFPERQFAYSRAYVAARKAPLYREQGDMDESLFYFTYAIEQCAPYAGDPQLQVELFRNRAHVHAVKGDETSWRADIAAANHIADRLPSPVREETEGLIAYSEGEGLKRLTAAPHLSGAQRRAYAQASYDMLQRSLTMVHSQWAAHALLVTVSEAQCLLWLDPVEAIALVERIRPQVELVYPAMLEKIDRVITVAQRRLSPSSHGRRGT